MAVLVHTLAWHMKRFAGGEVKRLAARAQGPEAETRRQVKKLKVKRSWNMVFVVLGMCYCYACKPQPIEGNVQSTLDSSGLPFANIIVYSNDSFVYGVTCDSTGHFQFEHKPISDTIQFKISCFGYYGLDTSYHVGQLSRPVSFPLLPLPDSLIHRGLPVRP